MASPSLTSSQRRRQRRRRNRNPCKPLKDKNVDNCPSISSKTSESAETFDSPERLLSPCSREGVVVIPESAPSSPVNEVDVRAASINLADINQDTFVKNEHNFQIEAKGDCMNPFLSQSAVIIPPETDIATTSFRGKIDKVSRLHRFKGGIPPSIDDYFLLGDTEFARVWKRSLRLLKKAYESDPFKHDGLVFHAKVYEDICSNEAVWFDFFLADRGHYTAANPPFFDTAEQAIIVLSTLADSKPWGSGPLREEASNILDLAQRFLERLQELSGLYGDDERKDRSNHVAHTLMIQVLHFHSRRATIVSLHAVEAFRTCAELELRNLAGAGEVLSWIPGRQRMTLAKLREVPDVKVWKWIIRHNRTRGSRRW